MNIARQSHSPNIFRRGSVALAAGVLLSGAVAQARPIAAESLKDQPRPPQPSADMKAVLDTFKAMKPVPIHKLRPAKARKQPFIGEAVPLLLKKRGQSAAPEAVGSVVDKDIPGPNGKIRVRVYKPKGNGPFPVIVYLHGGGWVLASVTAYDASIRALTNSANAMTVAVAYPLAPEHPFPAAHEVSYAATQWVMKNVSGWGGDPKRVAIAGESAGGNMAAALCLMARDRKGLMPIHQLLVYPVTNYGFNTPSYIENQNAVPLNRPAMKWFFHYTVAKKADLKSPYLSILDAHSLKGLPPATVVNAEIDPLRSEGSSYAWRLKQAGVPMEHRLYKGVTHEFFGMGAVVSAAKQAEAFAGERLRAAFKE